MTPGYSVYQLSYDPGTARLRSSYTTVRAMSFQFNLSSDCFCWPVQTAIVPVYRSQAARSAVNKFRPLARSTLLYHISSDLFFLEFLKFSREPNITYNRINYTKSPASGPDIISKPRLMSQVGNARSLVHVDLRVSAVRVMEVPVFVCLRSSCRHVTKVRGPLGLWDSRCKLSYKITGCIYVIQKNQ